MATTEGAEDVEVEAGALAAAGCTFELEAAGLAAAGITFELDAADCTFGLPCVAGVVCAALVGGGRGGLALTNNFGLAGVGLAAGSAAAAAQRPVMDVVMSAHGFGKSGSAHDGR